MKKAQFAMEYLLVVGFSILLTIPLVWYLFQGYGDMRKDVHIEQLSEVAREIAFQTEKVYYQGPSSRSLITAYFPPGITRATIINSTDEYGVVEFELDGFQGTIYRTITANICDFHELKTFSGPHNIKIIANETTGCIYYEDD